MKRYITNAEGAPKAIGPYSQAVIAGNMVFISGQIPINPDSGKLVSEGIEAQTVQVMKNLRAILQHLDLNFSNVVKSTIFLTDLANFEVVNSVYEKSLSENKPARATVQVSALPKGALVEIEMIAAI